MDAAEGAGSTQYVVQTVGKGLQQTLQDLRMLRTAFETTKLGPSGLKRHIGTELKNRPGQLENCLQTLTLTISQDRIPRVRLSGLRQALEPPAGGSNQIS